MKSSGRLPSSSSFSSPAARHAAAALAVLAALSATSLWWCASHGYTLYYGDAEAHLNIARRVLDSRTPGPEQLGTVWLPLPHLLMLPFVARDEWWFSGWAGALPSALSFIAAGGFVFAAARRCLGTHPAAWAAMLVFALNPNMLYLQSAPMTEPIFAAALTGLLWATLWFRDSQSIVALLAAAIAVNAASLTRYEGWVLAPAAALYVWTLARDKRRAVLFTALAALGPLAWLAHNQYYYSNPLEFYDGDYSAMAIYRRQLAQGMARYPGDHDWLNALQYYFAAMKLTIGFPALLAGACGAGIAVVKRAWWPVVLLLLPPAFYILSIHSSGTPIYVPHLWPHAWYNTRYGLAALPLAALSVAALVSRVPARWQAIGSAVAALIVALALAETPVTWKESQVNSAARRAWTGEAAALLRQHYRPGSGLIYSFGDLTGVLREARIPLREGRHEGNRPYWDAAAQRPDLFLHDEWAMAVSGDKISTAIVRAGRNGPHYESRGRIIVKGASPVELYQRGSLKP